MLQFGHSVNTFVPVLALASRQKDSIERVTSLGKHRAGFLTIVVEINPHRTTLNESYTLQETIQAGNCNSMPKRTWR